MTILIIIISYHKIMPYLGLKVILMKEAEEGYELKHVQIEKGYKHTCIQHKTGIIYPLHFEDENDQKNWEKKVEGCGYTYKKVKL